MKRVLLILVVLLFSSSFISTKAVSFPNQLPGGKNYFDPENFIINGNNLTTRSNIKVKENQDYTISFPGSDLIGSNIELIIEGTATYIEDYVAILPNCDVQSDIASCTFTTSAAETAISIYISADTLNYYYGYYEMENFQLEEGMIATNFEPYVKPMQDTTSPSFGGSGAYILSYENTESIDSIISNHIIAIDDIDGDISENIVIESDEYTSNEGVIGLYDVILSATDSSNNTAYFTLSVVVKDEIDPVITGPESVTVNVDDATILTNIISSNFTFYDGYDHAVTDTVTVNEYTGYESVTGTYNVSFEVSDSSSNKTTKAFQIHVIDTTSPVLVSNHIISVNTSDDSLIENIVNELSFTDNYNNSNELTTMITLDNYSSNKHIPGTYEVRLSTSDLSGNNLISTLEITVIDDEHPTISGPVTYSFSYENSMTLEDIKALYTVGDNVSNITTDNIVFTLNEYAGNEQTVGTYQVVFEVVDEALNKTIHTLEIHVIDDIAPIIYVDNYIVTVDSLSTFTKEDAVKLLMNANEIPSGNYQVTSIIDEYSDNKDTPGIYQYKIRLEAENGEEFFKDFAIKVNGESSDDYNENVTTRNIAIYGFVTLFIVYVYRKKK